MDQTAQEKPIVESVWGLRLWDKIAFILLLIAALTSPTQWGFGGAKGATIPAITIFDLLLGLCFIAFCIDVIIAKRWRQLTWPAAPLVALIICGALSITIASDKKLGIKELLQWIEIFIVSFMVLVNVASDRRRFSLVLTSLALGITFVVGMGVFHYFSPSRSAFDVKSTFGNRNTYSAFLALALPLLWGGVAYLKCIFCRVWLAMVVVAGLLTILSAGALIAALAGIVLIGAFKSRSWLVTSLILILCAVIVPEMVRTRNPQTKLFGPRNHIAILDESISFMTTDPTNNDAPITNPRYLEWEAVKKSFRHKSYSTESRKDVTRRMLLGVGIGNFHENITPQYFSLKEEYGFDKPNFDFTEPDTNSLYAVMAFSTGLPALAMLIWLIIEAMARSACGAVKASDQKTRALLFGVLGALVAFAIVSMFTVTMVRGIHFIIMVLITSAYCFNKPQKDSECCR